MHPILLKKFVLNQPLEDSFREERLHPDKEIIIPQDDLYIKLWETNFGEQLVTRGNEPIPTSLPNGEQPVTSNADSNDADENEVDYIIANDSPNDVNYTAQERNERLNDEVSKRNPDIEAEKNENSDWPNPAVYPKNQEKSLPNVSERQKNDANFWKKILLMKTMHKILPKRG